MPPESLDTRHAAEIPALNGLISRRREEHIVKAGQGPDGSVMALEGAKA